MTTSGNLNYDWIKGPEPGSTAGLWMSAVNFGLASSSLAPTAGRDALGARPAGKKMADMGTSWAREGLHTTLPIVTCRALSITVNTLHELCY